MTFAGLQGLLEAGSWFEANGLAGFDANLSACARVTTFAGRPFLHREGAETRVGEAAIFFDGFPYNAKDAVYELAGSFLSEIHPCTVFDDLINEFSLGHVSYLPLIVLVENTFADLAVTITAPIFNRVYPLRIRRQGLCRAKLPRKRKNFALSTYAGRARGAFLATLTQFLGCERVEEPCSHMRYACITLAVRWEAQQL
jgi:hypothetical protein